MGWHGEGFTIQFLAKREKNIAFVPNSIKQLCPIKYPMAALQLCKTCHISSLLNPSPACATMPALETEERTANEPNGRR